jgi:quinol monooxygenase YgiN
MQEWYAYPFRSDRLGPGAASVRAVYVDGTGRPVDKDRFGTERAGARVQQEDDMTSPPVSSAHGMLLASIGFRVQPHKRDEVLSAADETVRRMRSASGCTRSRLMADADDPNAFTMLSEWQSADTADVFFNSRDFQIFKGIRILLRDEPVIVFDEVHSRIVRLLRTP